MSPTPEDALAVLRRHWGVAAFRPGQGEAVEAVLAGRDALAVLPTGGGKSLLYQLPAALLGGVTLVVSPLIALMDDQVAGLARRGLPAVALHAGRSAREVDQALTDAEHGRYRLVYLTPERLVGEGLAPRLARLPVVLLAVDEAHCISEWGHDFRPAYRRLAGVRAHLAGPRGSPPVLAVTATATPEVRRDVVEQLALRDPLVVVRGFDRPNLVWSVHRVENKRRKALEIARAVPGSGIVYAGTRRGAENWAAALARDGVPSAPYHGGLPASARARTQEAWLRGEVRWLAATSAFGMGVDKPDVRAVVHAALPPTLEAYYQEAGRAGRDGRRAYCALLVRDGDESLPRALAVEGHPDAATLQRVYATAASLAGLAVGSAPDGPRAVDAERLARAAGLTPLAVRASVERLADAGAWEPLRTDARTGYVRLGAADELRQWADRTDRPALARFARALLRRLPPEAHSGWAAVRVDALARRLGLPPEQLLRGLRFLAERALLDMLPPGAGLVLRWPGPRAERLALDAAALSGTRQRALARLDHVTRYVGGLGCRRRHLLAYFGEPAAARCGRCDVCLGRHRPALVTPAEEPLLRRILQHVERGEARPDWLANETLPARRLDALVDWLLAEGFLRLADPLADAYELAPKGLRMLKKTR